MSTHFIENHFDIHGGGMDLTFPHHENEIAQSEGANNCKFVNTWMHVGFVNINDEKMSKSLDNFFTIRDVLEKYDGETVRYFLMSSHYRSPLNFSDENIAGAKSALKRLYTAYRGLSIDKRTLTGNISDFENRFNSALDDDFNTPIALSILFEIAKQININRKDNLKQAKTLAQLLIKLGNYIGILEYDVEDYLKQGMELSELNINEKIRQRDAARDSKDFALSDQIRDELLALGIILEDSSNGTTWRKK
jgi:cysteinyl-tRNA synthetase